MLNNECIRGFKLGIIYCFAIFDLRLLYRNYLNSYILLDEKIISFIYFSVSNDKLMLVSAVDFMVRELNI